MTRLYSTVEGVADVQAALAALPEAFREVVAKTIEVGADIIEGEADARVPEESGDLRKSIGKEIRPDGLQATIGAGEPYARWVEFATVDTPAQPFLWPAFRIGARFVRSQIRDWAVQAGEKVRLKTKRNKRPKA